jgi:hypothetical protein
MSGSICILKTLYNLKPIEATAIEAVEKNVGFTENLQNISSSF